MKVLLIYGSGGLGTEMADLARLLNKQNNRWDEICFINDFTDETTIYGCGVIDFVKARELHQRQSIECIIAVGEPADRQMLFEKCKRENFKMTSLIAPSAIISDTATIGEGVIISHHVWVSSNCRIGDNVLLSPTCNIGHDCVIERNSMLSALASIGGKCTIGSNSFIGMSAAVRDKVLIGKETIISMGAMVMSDMPDEVIVMGNPARAIRRNEDKRVFKQQQSR